MKQSKTNQKAIKMISLRMPSDLAESVRCGRRNDKRSFNQMVNTCWRSCRSRSKEQSGGANHVRMASGNSHGPHLNAPSESEVSVRTLDRMVAEGRIPVLKVEIA
jgi:catalase (peroxidase I)